MEFETLYKQTFAQVRCPACVAVAAQPAPRRRFGWVICLAAPLLLAAGVLALICTTPPTQAMPPMPWAVMPCTIR